ncbi:PP2C family protein-serine/threonine phosphatase [Streptomyces sp. XY006]|uniref:PP2C family protein-serine/threonine phosphatase n=1 Tax=Streptomyces sp. XY006 TaxID=2021410 RepID=UPI000B8C031C|nr:GAF domain-containing SpoIIE family protein phosphatase [Streptomyces sp. XY006]OXS32554.1 phosphatase [Streptomyces sp. XY006]
MTRTPDKWTIVSATDAAHARIAAARLTTACGVPLVDRACFLTTVTSTLRQCLEHGGTWELRLRTHPGTDGHSRVEATVRPAHAAPSGQRIWQLSVPALECATATAAAPAHLDTAAVAEGILAADEDTAELLDRLDAQHELVRSHRDELHRTNQGVLALHAELDAADHSQRDLLAAEQTARAQADNARRLLTFLADASDAVTTSLHHEEIMRRLPGLLVPRHARHTDVWLFDDERGVHHAHRPAAAVGAARTGRPQHAAAHPGNLPGVDDLPSSASDRDHPVLCVPLIGRGLLGVLTLTAPGTRFDPDEAIVLIELARRTGIALDNARRYERHRDTAEALQRAQLTDLPATPDVLLAARYLPATRGLNIGGDWYDAFLQPDGSLITAVGDVSGHGLRAALVMGQLRTALRAYAIESDTPAGILTRLHRLVRTQEHDLYATAVIASFRPGDPNVLWASAGHPPALVRDPAGEVRALDDKPGAMLGVPLPYEHRDHTAVLPPGSALALYTDGLVERRTHGIDPGIHRLGQALAALSRTELESDPDAAAEALLKPLLHDSGREDDICLLLCART